MAKTYRLSFCEITEIDKDIFEVVVDEEVTVDAACAKEELDFWTKLREEPFCVLLNCNTSFSYDYAGAAEIGQSPLQRKIAVVVYTGMQYKSNSLAMTINKSTMPEKVAQIFHNRESALAWLRE